MLKNSVARDLRAHKTRKVFNSSKEGEFLSSTPSLINLDYLSLLISGIYLFIGNKLTMIDLKEFLRILSVLVESLGKCLNEEGLVCATAVSVCFSALHVLD